MKYCIICMLEALYTHRLFFSLLHDIDIYVSYTESKSITTYVIIKDPFRQISFFVGIQ